jgi:chitinase
LGKTGIWVGFFRTVRFLGNAIKKEWIMLRRTFLGSFLLIFVYFFIPVVSVDARDVVLQWAANMESDLAGYKVYYQADSAATPFNGTGAVQGSSPIDVKNQTTTTLNGLDAAKTYYFAVTAYNTAGKESSYSNIVATDMSAIPKTNWKLKYADSQETSGENGAATNAFDGSTNTIWHTQWSSSSPACPHEIQIDLGATYNISSFSYIPRQDGNMNGTIAQYEFYISADGTNWGTAVATGTFDSSSNEKQVLFTAKQGRYIRLRALSEINGNPWTSAAEINVFGSSVTTADTTSPTVFITSPANSTISGTTTVSMSASDNVGVTKVELYINGALAYTGNSASSSYSWNTTAVSNGTYTLLAKAYDAAGNVGQSASKSVTVSNQVSDCTAPTASITSPVSNSTVSGNVTINISSSDNVGVSKVELYINNSLRYSGTSANCSYTWNTAAEVNNQYTLVAKAYDVAGNVGQSSYVFAIVNNTTPSSGSKSKTGGKRNRN